MRSFTSCLLSIGQAKLVTVDLRPVDFSARSVLPVSAMMLALDQDVLHRFTIHWAYTARNVNLYLAFKHVFRQGIHSDNN